MPRLQRARQMAWANAPPLVKEAQAIFPNTRLARDFLTVNVQPRCNSS